MDLVVLTENTHLPIVSKIQAFCELHPLILRFPFLYLVIELPDMQFFLYNA